MENVDHDAPASCHSPPLPSAASRAPATSSITPSGFASSSAFNPGPTTHPLRRCKTVDDAPPLRRRQSSMTSFLSSDAGEPQAPGVRRRGSALSDFSMTDARRTFRDGTQEIFYPSAAKQTASTQDASSIFSWLPLVFALLPAFFGILFEGGGPLIADLMLLGLALIFLHYTLTQPWNWYHETQEVRIRQEVGLEQVSEEGSDEGTSAKMDRSLTALDEVLEEEFEDAEEGDHKSQSKHTGQRETNQYLRNRTRAQEAAANELYTHEVLALTACFLSPVLGCYLLHTIGAHLTRAEGMFNYFNIMIFLLGAEVRPVSHGLKLIQARTLHLQRVVQSEPVAKSTTLQLEEMRIRLAELELRNEVTAEATAAALANVKTSAAEQSGASGGHKDATVREVRNAIQPDIDAVTRAVRRYEKKVTIMAVQTAAQLNTMDTRLDDAVALAAAAAKQHNNAQWGLVPLAAWLVDWFVTIVTMPYYLAMCVVMWPFKTVASACFKGRRSSKDARDSTGRSGRHYVTRGSRNSSSSEKDRYRDRVPSRLSGRYSP